MARTAELGRTRLHTRRDRRRVITAVGVALLGVALSVACAGAVVSWVSGRGFRPPSVEVRPLLVGRADPAGARGGPFGLPLPATPSLVPASDALTPPPDPPGAATTRRAQFPIALRWSAPPGWTIGVATPLWLLWLRLAVVAITAPLRGQARHRGLASPRSIRATMGTRTVRRAGRYTLPTAPWHVRLRLPTSAFGYRLGHPIRPTGRRWLWADWEHRIRIVARTGWGKTDRLLVPIIRALPGAAVVNSTEPGIFEKTVTARQFRRPTLRWRWLSHLLRHWLAAVEYPVAVVDFTPPHQRYAAGYPQVRWPLLRGCADFTIAHRRAVALVSGIDYQSDNVHGSDNDRFFRDSAAEILAAWLHAAALGGKTLDDLIGWLDRTDDPTPARILRDDPRADRSAALNVRTHLDPAAGRTTSGVKRYLALTMNALATEDSRMLCGQDHDGPTAQFDMDEFITAGGTLYLLADPSWIDRVRPLLNLLASEMFLAAESVALRARARRLPTPFIAVLDELRYAITIPNLPYIASAMRKYGIGYVYTLQSATQEDAVYGADAPALRAAAGVSIYGGIDIDSSRELSDRAGVTTVVTPTRGDHRYTEQLQPQTTLTIGDQQQLADGEATVIVRGLAPFFARIPSFRERGVMKRAVMNEAAAVAARVAVAREHDLATHRAHTDAAAAGARFPPRNPT